MSRKYKLNNLTGLKHQNYNQTKKTLKLKEADNTRFAPQVVASAYNYKYNGKELQTELGLQWYDYGARNYRADTTNWGVIDPLAEKYPSWSPYNFVNSNPMCFIDPTGLAPKDIIIKGRKSAKDTFINIINQGLGGNFASYDKKGNVTLNVNRDDLKTDTQKGMFDIINKAITSKDNTTLKLLNHKDLDFGKIVAGSFMKNNSSLGKLDVDDIAAYGIKDPVMNQSTVLTHEVDEQYRKQVLGNNVYSNDEGTGAHNKADGVFKTITGYTRGKSDLGDGIKYNKVVRPGNKYYTRSYNAIVPFTKGGKTHSVKYQVINGQVVKKE